MTDEDRKELINANSIETDVELERVPNIAERVGEKSMEIIDLNDDCLEVIFAFLTGPNLINLAEASPRFKEAAAQAYKRAYKANLCIFIDYRRECLKIQRGCLKRRSSKQETSISQSAYVQRTNDRYLRILRNFGKVFSTIWMQINIDEFDSQLLDEIIKNCKESLTDLSVYLRLNKGPSSIARIPEERDWCLSSFLQGIAANFPNLKKLSFGGNNDYLRDLRPIVMSLPNLVSLSVEPENDSNESFVEMLRLNPQLESIAIHYPFPTGAMLTSDTIEALRKNGSHLRRLQFFIVTVDPRANEVDANAFDRLEQLYISTTKDDPRNLLKIFGVSGNKLEKLSYLCVDDETSESLIETISQYKRLKYLHISSLSDAQLGTLATNLPDLICLKLGIPNDLTVLTPRGVCNFLKRCPKLGDVCVKRNYRNDFSSEWTSLLNNAEWKTTVSNGFLSIERK